MALPRARREKPEWPIPPATWGYPQYCKNLPGLSCVGLLQSETLCFAGLSWKAICRHSMKTAGSPQGHQYDLIDDGDLPGLPAFGSNRKVDKA
jgi:hypothetical protein